MLDIAPFPLPQSHAFKGVRRPWSMAVGSVSLSNQPPTAARSSEELVGNTTTADLGKRMVGQSKRLSSAEPNGCCWRARVLCDRGGEGGWQKQPKDYEGRRLLRMSGLEPE